MSSQREGVAIAVLPTASIERRRAATLAAAAFLAVSLAGCANAPPLPARQDPRADGEPVEIGVAYGVTVSCPIPIELGGLWWTFDEPVGDWPPDISIPPFPFSIWATVTSPYAVPGIVTLSDSDTAVFRADVDGSEFPLSAHETDPSPGDACL